MRQLAQGRTGALFILAAFGFVFTASHPALSASADATSQPEPVGSPSGLYEGYSTAVISAATTCPRPGPVTVDIRDRHFKLVWQNGQTFDATISPIGTFSAALEPPVQAEKHMTLDPTLDGHVNANTLVADYGTRWCRYRLEATELSAKQHTTQHAAGTIRQ